MPLVGWHRNWKQTAANVRQQVLCPLPKDGSQWGDLVRICASFSNALCCLRHAYKAGAPKPTHRLIGRKARRQRGEQE
jgi:hypothetical protein